jgi:hypothetical protein
MSLACLRYCFIPSPFRAGRFIIINQELGFIDTHMKIMTLQQIIDERISFLKEQINPNNKPQVNSTFQLQIDAIKSVDDMEKVEALIMQKGALGLCIHESILPSG